MNARERFINVVKKGSEKPYVSFQIGAGAGFDCKLAGRAWISQGTLADTIRAYEMVGCDPLFNVVLPDVGAIVPSLNWNTEIRQDATRIVTFKTLDTPYGPIHWKLMEQPRHGITPQIYPLNSDSEHFFDIVRWYAEQMGKAEGRVGQLVKAITDHCHRHGPVSIQWNIQPFELLGLASVPDLAIKAMTEPTDYRKACDLITEVNTRLIRQVFEAGADFVFLGGPGAEMLSPQLYEDFLIPDSIKITTAAHQIGGLIYSHICSPIEPFLSKGYYSRMGIDLFETLSPPPVGNVTDLASARKILDPTICTRGNIGLDVLLNGTPAEIEKATVEVIEATRDSKHMVAASDYLFYDIPLDNVKAVVTTVENYYY